MTIRPTMPYVAQISRWMSRSKLSAYSSDVDASHMTLAYVAILESIHVLRFL